MAAFSEILGKWKHFPKGLSVLVIDRDNEFLQDLSCKLQSYGYFVTSFSSGCEACAALANDEQTFHVALVEATESNDVDTCKVLEFSRKIPTIMISGIENMSIMINTIALGAVEFLLKPLSEDKLKNIWQHVVRKALDSGDRLQPGYLQPRKDDLHNMSDSDESGITRAGNLGETCHDNGSQSTQLSASYDRFPAPSTPQLEQGGRQDERLDESPRSHDLTGSVNGRFNAALPISSLSKENSKEVPMSVLDSINVKKEANYSDQDEITCCATPMPEFALHNEDADATQTNDTKEQCDLIDANDYNGLKIDERASAEVNKDDNENQMVGENITVQKDDCRVSLNCMNIDSTSSSQSFRYEDLKDGNKRKSNVSQKTGKEKQSNQEKKSKKYRSQQKHHLGKEMEANNLRQSKITCGKPWNKVGQNKMWICPQLPMIYPCPPLHVWGHPAVDNSTIHVMPHYNHVMVPGISYGPHMFFGAPRGYDQGGLTFSTLDNIDTLDATNRYRNSTFLIDMHPPKELLDAAINEALNDPWAPLPLGLKPPSMESVMAELQQQGIDTLTLDMQE